MENLALSGIHWLWEVYGRYLTDTAFGRVRESWEKFKWREAEAKYRDHLWRQHSTTKLLGNPKPIVIEDIFTSVYVIDKPAALQRYDIKELEKRGFSRDVFALPYSRQPAMPIVLDEKQKRLYILGRPGSGKTTFLKFLTLQACKGVINRTPIFISIKEWGDSNLDLLSYIVQQFDICGFPDAKAFIVQMLRDGKALVLFDGLDEATEENKLRRGIIQSINNFASKYQNTKICLTCRTASVDYTFTSFTYLEIADFDDEQVRQFVTKWYQNDKNKSSHFLSEFTHSENEAIFELSHTPLLLAMLCLAFDETLVFPRRRIDLYRDALDALLKKWDASRGVIRDEIYRRLPPRRKEHLLSRIAYENFEMGRYFIMQEILVTQIDTYLAQLPPSDIEENMLLDGEYVLKAIEAQHGILVERAHRIFSFSHLTFQEYFSALFMVESETSAMKTAIEKYATDDRWHEVFLLVSSMLNNADKYFEYFLDVISKEIRGNENLVSLLKWINENSNSSNYPRLRTRAVLLFLLVSAMRLQYINREEIPFVDTPFDTVVNLAFNLALDLEPTMTQLRRRERAPLVKQVNLFDLNPKRLYSTARHLGTELLGKKDIERLLNRINYQEIDHLEKYIKGFRLLVECLSVAVISDRTKIESRILAP